jgi:hypothetical protein
MKRLSYLRTQFIVNWKNGSIIFLILGFLMVRMDQPLDFQGNRGIILKIMDQGNNNNEAYNGKLGGVVNKPNQNIWWFIDLIKSENTHFTLLYHRLKDNFQDAKGFKERKRDPREIQKDLELTKRENRYLKNEFDVIEESLFICMIIVEK